MGHSHHLVFINHVYGVDVMNSRQFWDMVEKLQDKNQEKRFIEWIKSQPCYFGGKIMDEDKFPYFCEQSWDDQKGEYVSDPSHIMRKGSTRRKEHLGNLFPNCRKHHVWFESMNPAYRFNYKSVGEEYYQRWLSENNS